MRIHAFLKVACYVLYDPWTQELEGYSLSGDRYERVPLDSQGRLRCAPLDLWLGIEECEYNFVTAPWLRWFDAEGRPLLLHGEYEQQRADAEKQRADAEKQRADALAKRVAELERLLE